MLNISDLATEKLLIYLNDNNISSALRVAVMQGGCAGPSLGLALDEKKETDESFEHNGLTFLVEKSVLEQCGAISVDFMDAGAQSGFTISSENPLPGAGGGCSGGTCGSGGCGC